MGFFQPVSGISPTFRGGLTHTPGAAPATSLTSEEVLRLVVMPDEQGRYYFDEIGSENLPEYLGYLVGYLGGPLAPDEETRYRKEHAQQEQLRSSVTA